MSPAEQFVSRYRDHSRIITIGTPASSSVAILSLVVSDLLAAVCTLLIIHLISDGGLTPWLLASFLGFWTSLFLFGLIPGRGLFGPDRVRLRTILAVMAFLPAAAVCGAWISDWGTAAQQFSLASVGIIFFGGLFEVATISILVRKGHWLTDVMVVGDPVLSRNVRIDLELFPELGLRPVDTREPAGPPDNVILRTQGAGAGEYLADPSSPLPLLQPLKRTPASATSLAHAVQQAAKRIMDFSGALILLVLVSPVMLFAALLILLADGRPIFFRQKRGGLNDGAVHVWKFRSMYRDAPERLESVLASCPQKRAEWGQFFKLHDDPRILPVIGNFIRKTSIDELPQLWNVLKGEMSLVGPRPFPDNHLSAFSREFVALRHQVLPGITGLWQVTLRSDGDLEMQQRLDTAYVRGWSIWLDIYILFRTPVVLLSSRGAR